EQREVALEIAALLEREAAQRLVHVAERRRVGRDGELVPVERGCVRLLPQLVLEHVERERVLEEEGVPADAGERRGRGGRRRRRPALPGRPPSRGADARWEGRAAGGGRGCPRRAASGTRRPSRERR